MAPMHEWKDDAEFLRYNPPVKTLRCRLFGHKWRIFDRNWCGTDYLMCRRMGCHTVISQPTKDIPSQARSAPR